MKRLPAPDLEVYISVVRRAKRVSDGEGGYSWELINSDPINLETDTVHWMHIPIE